MDELEFVGQMNLKPFKSLAKLEQERVEAIKEARLKSAGKPQPEPEPQYTREPFID